MSPGVKKLRQQAKSNFTDRLLREKLSNYHTQKCLQAGYQHVAVHDQQQLLESQTPAMPHANGWHGSTG